MSDSSDDNAAGTARSNLHGADWYVLALGDGITAAATIDEIREAFAAHATTARRQDMAAFIRYDSDSSLHCEVTAYFSPAAAGMAARFGALPCAGPTQKGLDLLAGDERCWRLLFEA